MAGVNAHRAVGLVDRAFWKITAQVLARSMSEARHAPRANSLILAPPATSATDRTDPFAEPSGNACSFSETAAGRKQTDWVATLDQDNFMLIQPLTGEFRSS